MAVSLDSCFRYCFYFSADKLWDTDILFVTPKADSKRIGIKSFYITYRHYFIYLFCNLLMILITTMHVISVHVLIFLSYLFSLVAYKMSFLLQVCLLFLLQSFSKLVNKSSKFCMCVCVCVKVE